MKNQTQAVAHSLRADGFDASEDGTGRGTPLVATAFEPRMVRTTGGQPSTEMAHCLKAAVGGGDGKPCVQHGLAVRRLTPRECERLQGFPDDWTLIPWRKATAENCPDGPRYKSLGNSMAVPVMKWIGQRILQVDQIP